MNFTIKPKKKTILQPSVGGFESWQSQPIPGSEESVVKAVDQSTDDYMDTKYTEDKLDPDLQHRVDTWIQEGTDFAEQGQYEEALSMWQKAVHVSPQLYKVHEMKAQVYLMLEQSLLALQAAEYAVQLVSDWIPGVHTLARCQREVGELYLSEASFQRVLALNNSQENPDLDLSLVDEIQTELAEVQELIKQLEVKQIIWQEKLHQCNNTKEDEEVFRCKLHLALRAKTSQK